MKQKYVVLVGPIAGVENYRENFLDAEFVARKAFNCAYIWNPSIIQQGKALHVYMTICFRHISEASVFETRGVYDSIVIALPNIGEKSGANVELAYARYLGLKIVTLDEVKKGLVK